MSAVMDGWQAEAVDLKKQGLDAYAIAEQVGKTPATIREALAKARDAGLLPQETGGLSAEEAERLAQAAETGEVQTTVDEQIAEADVPPNDDPHDPLDDFREEAGEAVGPMPPAPEEDVEIDYTSRLKGTRQAAIDFGPECDIPTGGTLVIKSSALASGHFGMGDIITGTFTARISDIGGKERVDKASEEWRAKPTAYVATIVDVAFTPEAE